MPVFLLVSTGNNVTYRKNNYEDRVGRAEGFVATAVIRSRVDSMLHRDATPRLLHLLMFFALHMPRMPVLPTMAHPMAT